MTLKEWLSGSEPLEEESNFKRNSQFGAVLLGIGVINSSSLLSGKELPHWLYAIFMFQLILGFFLSAPYVLNKLNWCNRRNLLIFQGVAFILIVVFYTYFMWGIFQKILSGTIKSGMAHAPGILTGFFLQGIRQIIDFSELRDKLSLYKIKTIMILSLIFGGLCDLLIMYFVITAGLPDF